MYTIFVAHRYSNAALDPNSEHCANENTLARTKILPAPYKSY
jgi:hypothetical protein